MVAAALYITMMDPVNAFAPLNVAIGEGHITIRGVRLNFDELVDERQLLPDNALRLRENIGKAEPFAHLLLKNLFHDRLLELIHDEFDMRQEERWKSHSNAYEDTRRSTPGSRLGPAAQLYFWLVNSWPVTQFLSTATGIDNLIPDPLLVGGGMHETRNAGHFSIHRDFEVHEKTGLSNAMVFITYLNKDWAPSYQGSLELWDHERQLCVKKVSPDFGVSLLLPHGPTSYHGYSTPLNIPVGRTRRSVASYYYTHQRDTSGRAASTASKFLFTARSDVAKGVIKEFIPPIVWNAFKKLRR